MESTLVIKVKYGDTLRRFNARVDGNKILHLDIHGLREKITVLFNLPPDTDLNLTYIDEDGDVVTLVDDEDLHDVMRQRLNFLRIEVQLNNDKGPTNASSTGSSTPLRSPQVPNLLPIFNNEVLKSVSEPLLETLSKLPLESASKVASSSPLIAEIIDSISKMAQIYTHSASQSEHSADVSADNSANVNKSAVLPNSAKADGTPRSIKKVDTANETKSSAAQGMPVTPVEFKHVLDPLNLPVEDFRDAKKVGDGQIGKGSVGFRASRGSAKVLPPWMLMKECPFSGLPLGNGSGLFPYLPPPTCPFKNSNNNTDAMGGIFHRGIECDRCGVCPIRGPRFKSKVKENYDLCSICFSGMGNEADYIRMDRPVSYRHHRNVWGGPGGFGIKVDRPKPDSCFILDVTIMDGTTMAPSTPFTKIWRMRNTGNFVWPQGTRLVWIGGDKLTDAVSVELEIPAGGLPVDAELDIAVDFSAPELPGRYISYWRMSSSSGHKFGQRVWVLIQVDAKDSTSENLERLNLNLPPDSGYTKGPQVIDVTFKPADGGGFADPHVSSAVTGTVDELLKTDQEQNFPTYYDALLVKKDGIASAPPEVARVSYPPIDLSEGSQVGVPSFVSNGNLNSSTPKASSVSYPTVDFSEAGPSHAPSPVTGLPASSDSGENVTVEQTCLKELEEMGFRQVDLNKEILRMNEYNLEKSLDDLCGVAEWDPLLEELMEMGFCDTETNKMLLKKNNGSIKRVVMDLISGQKHS